MSVTYAKINVSNFIHNLEVIKKYTNRRICMAAKADCYGHGAEYLVSAAEKKKLLDAVGIADVSEGISLRKAGIKLPILIFRGCTRDVLSDVIAYDIQPFVSNLEYIKAIEKEAEKAGKKQSVHLKIDSGMSRAGCRCEDALVLAKYIESSPYLMLEGVCTHFAVSDSFSEIDVTDTKRQIANFKNAVDGIKAAGIKINTVHCAASGAIIAYPESLYDMVRPGIIAYGYAPSRELEGKLDLRPVMDFISHVLQVKNIKKGEKVSYGFTWQAEQDTTIAIIGAGYADGYNRLLSNKGKVCINGRSYPVAGRVCMDQMMVDVTGIPEVCSGDDVILLGESNGESITAEDLASAAGTISYEILLAATGRVHRIWTTGGEQ